MKYNYISFIIYYLSFIIYMSFEELPDIILHKILEEVPQLRFVNLFFRNLLIDHKKPKDCIYPTSNSIIKKVKFNNMTLTYCTLYFNSKRRIDLVTKSSYDPFDLRQGIEFICFNCMYQKKRSHTTYRVPHSRGNLDSVICTCSDECTSFLNSSLETTNIKLLQGKKFKINFEGFTEDIFHISSEIPVIENTKVYYHVTCRREDIEYSIWIDFNSIIL